AIHTIGDSVDLHAIRPCDGAAFRQRTGISSDHFVVLYSGGLGLKQDLRVAVEAARLLAAKCPDLRWVIVGEGETRKTLANLIESTGTSDRVLLLPLQP